MPHTEVLTTAGRVRGYVQGDVTAFLGIPYGADTRHRRFRAPAPAQNWEGVRDATSFGPACPQVVFTDEGDAAALRWLEHPIGGSPLEGGAIGEDCLRVNVWAPTTHAESLPVLVWLHGGGFTNGSGNEGWFNGDRLAVAGDVVVVTVTHRLGVFGFLSLHDDNGEPITGSANAGMLDIVLALQWVRDNIAAFGGDPSNVTIAGHSGGSGKVAALLAMPAAEGLFTRAIMQSGPVSRFPTAADSRATTERVLEALGEPTLAQLEQLTADELLQGQAAAFAGVDGSFLLRMDSIPGFSPCLDDDDLPAQPFETDDLTHVQLLIGYTTHEMSSLLAGAPIFSRGMGRDQVIATLEHFAPGHGEAQYDAAALEAPTEPPHLLFVRILGAGGFAQETGKIMHAVVAGGGTVWHYRFDQTTDALDGLLGACHGLEIPYVFGTTDRSPITGHDQGRETLSREMMHAWASFARDGVPEVRDEWVNWTPESPSAYRFVIPADA